MTKLFRSLVLLLAGLPAVSMLAGCGDGNDIITDEPVPVNFVSANPPSGAVIAANARITITFDNAPADVRVNWGAAAPSGKTVTVNGPFTPGLLNLTVIWADGTQELKYTVSAPCCAPAGITGGTVKDGDKDVDPEAINSTGKIEITFTEDVTGNIALQTEGGDDVGWLGKVDGSTATLELVKGKEIGNETVYVIAGKVATAEGNEAEIKITFVTKVKA